MKIGLLGYGRMGQAIEKIALERGHEIVWRIRRDNRDSLHTEMIQQADLVIEFSLPESAYANVMACLQAGIPVVSGTTGWLEQLEQARKWCADNQGTLLWASNFSVGVNLFFALNQFLSALMNGRKEYNPSVQETHHVHKLDAPSGTALTITHDILNVLDRKNGWTLEPVGANSNNIPITAIREGEVPGTHRVRWASDIDEITIEHKAHSRTGFASGAVLAAEWVYGKTGTYTMNDVLNLK